MFQVICFVVAVAVASAESPSWSYNSFGSGPYQPSGWRPSGPEFRLPEPHASQGSTPQEHLAPPTQEYGPPPQEYGPPPQEYGPPPQEYGLPSQEYGPPSLEYGPPSAEEPTTTEADVTTTDQSTTTEASTEPTTEATTEVTTEAESANSLDREQYQKLTQPAEEQGVYFIYHPSGLLQRIIYTTNDDRPNMAYTANFKYENVEPITGPVYTYDPNTFVFQRVN